MTLCSQTQGINTPGLADIGDKAFVYSDPVFSLQWGCIRRPSRARKAPNLCWEEEEVSRRLRAAPSSHLTVEGETLECHLKSTNLQYRKYSNLPEFGAITSCESPMGCLCQTAQGHGDRGWGTEVWGSPWAPPDLLFSS